VIFITGLKNRTLQTAFLGRHRGKEWPNLHEAYTAVHSAITTDPTRYNEPERGSARRNYPIPAVKRKPGGTIGPAKKVRTQTPERRTTSITQARRSHGASNPQLPYPPCPHCGWSNHAAADCTIKHSPQRVKDASKARAAASAQERQHPRPRSPPPPGQDRQVRFQDRGRSRGRGRGGRSHSRNTGNQSTN
jgi:hypothetical protein